MAVAVAVAGAVSGAVAVPVAGLTKRFLITFKKIYSHVRSPRNIFEYTHWPVLCTVPFWLKSLLCHFCVL